MRSVRIGCRRPGRLKRKPTNTSVDVRRRKRQRSPKSERRWMTQLRYMLRKRPFNFLPSDGSSKSKRAKTATSSGSKATEDEHSAVWPSRSREPKKSVASSVSVVGRPAPTGQNGTDHEVGIAREDRTGPTDARTPPNIILLDTTVDVERVSGPGPHLRVGPAPGDRRIRRVDQGPAVSLRGRRMSGLQGLPLIPITIITSHRVIVGPCLHHHRGRRPIASLCLVIIEKEDVKVLRGLVHPTSPDGKYSCPRPLPSHQREEPSR